MLTGKLGDDLHINLQKRLEIDWNKPRDGLQYWTMGFRNDTPVVDFAVSGVQAIYVVDIAAFASLTRYGELPEFAIEEFSRQRAQELLRQNPNLISEPPLVSGLEEARLNQLLLRVGLRLYETYDLEVRDPAAVIGRPLRTE